MRLKIPARKISLPLKNTHCNIKGQLGKPATTFPVFSVIMSIVPYICQPRYRKMYMDCGSFPLFANHVTFLLWFSCFSLLRGPTQKDKSSIYL